MHRNYRTPPPPFPRPCICSPILFDLYDFCTYCCCSILHFLQLVLISRCIFCFLTPLCEINSHHEMHTLSGCTPASSLRSSRARQALAMNRTQHTVMLSSIISERTVKKRAPFSHTLSLFHSLVLFIRVHPTLGQDDRTKLLMAFPFTFASPPPLLLSLFYSSLIFLAFHLLMQLC